MHDAAAEVRGANPDDLRRGLARLLTIAEPITRLTPNKLDDLAVAFLKLLVADPQAAVTAAFAAHVHDTYQIGQAAKPAG